MLIFPKKCCDFWQKSNAIDYNERSVLFALAVGSGNDNSWNLEKTVLPLRSWQFSAKKKPSQNWLGNVNQGASTIELSEKISSISGEVAEFLGSFSKIS